jgi:hypothetical protein
MTGHPGGVPVDYVLPLKWQDSDDGDAEELGAYLRWLSARARVIVVDSSPPPVFERHRLLWSSVATHVPLDEDGALNGKVAAVHTGLRHARAEAVVIADDDVRYDAESLRRTVALLEVADLVGPQNVFVPMPWHAAWDTARSLLNRAVAADYPGTFAVRRSTFVAMGGYDGDVLFENLELMRTVRAHGGRVLRPQDVYVTRRPPTLGRFLDQRVRQAYDDLAQPWRMATFLTTVPVAMSGRRGRRAVLAGLALSVAAAEAGRRRGGGRRVFPVRASLLAPAWVLERSVCAWSALGQRALLGGVRYAGHRLAVAAHSPAELRRRARAGRAALVPRGRPEPGGEVRAVAERLAGRPSAPAEGDGAPARVDALAVAPEDPEVAAHDERAVLVGRDRHLGPLVTHAQPDALAGRGQTGDRGVHGGAG